MKKLILYLVIFSACIFSAQSQVLKTMYIDFGPNDISNGKMTPVGHDVNGNHWNNVTKPDVAAAAVNIFDKDSVFTEASITITAAFKTNGILNGGLMTPEVGKLGDLAIATATEDYFYVESGISRLAIKGLDKTKGYVFSIFATRSTNTAPIGEVRKGRYMLLGKDTFSYIYQSSGKDLGGVGYHGNNSTILVTDTITPDVNGQICIAIKNEISNFAYLSVMKIQEVNAPVVKIPFCTVREQYQIAFMGSSVCYGSGASNVNNGYAYLYKQLLANRWSKTIGHDWNVSNISIGGQNTINVLDRWNSDLLPLCTKYVIYGLSLGNEGITTGGQNTFNQFRDNMLKLISQAKAKGMIPVVINCYTRTDYNLTDYDYVKKMNLLIHSWDVPSINSLGSIDDGTGKWVSSYRADDAHPNDLGHKEFSYAFVPSLFDAIDAGKAQPKMVDGTSLRLKPDSANFRLEFTAEETLHPFTFSFDIQTAGTGPIAEFKTLKGQCYLNIDSTGMLNYCIANANRVKGKTVLNDNKWHKVTLTHYYAMGKTFLYLDKELQGSFSEKIVSTTFNIGALNAPVANFRKLFFTRSGMNAMEITDMVNNKLLKSSLEIFAPLDEKAKYSADTLVNLAQCMNKVTKVGLGSAIIIDIPTNVGAYNSGNVSIYPNPANNNLYIDTDEVFSTISITNLNGKLVKSVSSTTSQIDISALTPGMYIVKLSGKKGIFNHKLVKVYNVN